MFAPIFFVEKLGCTPAAAGAYIAAASSINIPGQFVVGTMESLLINMGFTTLTIRRWSTGVGGLLCSAFALLYASADTPRQAVRALIGYSCSHLLHESGQFANFMELGGEDTALLTSVANSLANIPAIAVPPIGLALQSYFQGSWLPQFALGAALQSATALLWLRYCSVTPARKLLAVQDAKKAKEGKSQ
jgi:hypothetical protein